MTVGERVKKARENKGLSQTELAEMLGYKSRSSINKIEQGDRDIPRSSIIKLAEKLDVTPQYLMGWEEEKRSESELTDADRTALKLFRQLDEQSKQTFIQLMVDRLK